MASVDTICKSVLNVKNTVIENYNFHSDKDGVKHFRIVNAPAFTFILGVGRKAKSTWRLQICKSGKLCPESTAIYGELS